jgi:uncharacterized protein (DUF433 family)
MIYINVICDGGCKKSLPLYFDHPTETWDLMCGFVKHQGWLVVEFDSRKKLEHRTMKTYCPECRKEIDGWIEDFTSWREGLVNDPEIKGGETTFPGTRITVLGVGGVLKRGEAREDILEDFPRLTDRDLDYTRLYVEVKSKLDYLENIETEHGIRVPVRMWAEAAGVDLDQALDELE